MGRGSTATGAVRGTGAAMNSARAYNRGGDAAVLGLLKSIWSAMHASPALHQPVKQQGVQRWLGVVGHVGAPPQGLMR